MHSATIIVRPTSSTGTPIRRSVVIVARVDDHDHNRRARTWTTAVGTRTSGLQLIADATSRTAVGRAVGYGALKQNLVDGTGVVALAYTECGAGVALPGCGGFVVVAAVTGCTHVGVVLSDR